MKTTWPDHFSPAVVGRAFGGGRLSSYCIALEAWRRDLQVTWTRADLRNYIVSDGIREVRFNDSRPQSLTPRADYAKLIDKWTTKRHLEDHGVPVPRGILIEDSSISDETLDDISAGIGFPLVIKPNTGTMGQGVFSNVRTSSELHRVFRHLASRDPDSSILMERHVSGEDFRVMVVGDHAVAAVRRIPANVTGDGQRTIRQLINRKNKQRSANPFLSKGRIRVDFEVESVLAEQGLALTDTPTRGANVPLRRVANASAGGDVEDVTDDLPPGMAEAAVRAVQAVPNIYVAGVDFLWDQDASETFVVIEMNSRPHVPVNMYPTSGQGRDVPEAMLDYFFPDSSRRALPGDPLLNFDLGQISDVLRTRRARQVVLPMLPEHHLPIRRSITFTSSQATKMTRLRSTRLERRAGLDGVSGKLTRDDAGFVTAVIGAGDDASIDSFVEAVEKVLSLPGGTAEVWNGPLTFGFVVEDSLISH